MSKRDGGVITVNGRLIRTQRLVGIAPIQKGAGAGLDGNGPVKTGNRLICAPQSEQRIATVAIGLRIISTQADGMVIAGHCLNQLSQFDECTGAVTKCLHVAWVKGQHLVKTLKPGRKLFEFAHGKPEVVIGVIAVRIEFDRFAQEIYRAVQQSEFGINDSQHLERIAMPRVNGQDLLVNGFGAQQLIVCQARSGSLKLNFHQLSTSFWYQIILAQQRTKRRINESARLPRT